MTAAAVAPMTGHRMSRNRHREPVCRITLVGPHVYRRFATRMLEHQSEFHRMAAAILKAEPQPSDIWEIGDGTVDGFRMYRDEYAQAVVEITLVGWHSIHRFAYNMRTWQVEFAAMGRAILKSHRRAVGPAAWKELWAMYHGAHEKPMTFVWKREI